LKHLERNPKEPKGFVEILDQGIFHYPEKILGTGGLPVGTGGKLVVLLSGGIDSPVAAWKMMRRGCSVILVHFQNETQVTGSVEDKIHRLSKILSRHQFKTRLHVVKFGEIQRQIIAFSPAEIRMILYRRMMLRIAEKLMEKEGAKGLVTGDSLAQVASQTLDNLGIVYDAVSSPVLAPLIGDDKDAVISLAKRIGTFDTSILPYDDCCSFFVAKHPSTSTGIDEVRKVEGLLNMEQLIQHALRSTETKSFLMS